MVVIRELKASDEPMLSSFFYALSDETLTWQNHFGDANNHGEDIAYDEVNKANSEQLGYVAVEEIKTKAGPMLEFDIVHTKIVAYGWLGFGQKPSQRFTCSLGIVVHNSSQGKGIGTELTKFMIEEARKLKMRKIFLNCYTTNERPFKLYTKLGFEIEGIFRKQEYTKEDKPLDLYSLALFL